jgi:hypothetical protein
LTEEAIQMYLSKLAPGGIIIVNIANRYLDFKPIFGNLADELNLAAMMGESDDDDAWFIGNGRHADLYACSWILLAREKKDFGLLNDYLGTVHDRATWMEVPRKKELGVWTDDFSNLLSVFDWSRKE